jgi:hypothetical protein
MSGNWTDALTAISSSASVILTGAYVLLTLRTFREIKKQTDLQSDAFLIVSAKEGPGDPDGRSQAACEMTGASDKWLEILQANVPDAAQNAPRDIVLILTNVGKTDVVEWTISGELDVQPGKQLRRERNISGERLAWDVRSADSSHVVWREKSVTVPIARVQMFPLATMSWKISYVDARGKAYDRFSGDRGIKTRNILALPEGE